MGVEDIPIRDQDACMLAADDIAAFKGTDPPGFRLERTQLRLQAALENGLSEREAERLGQIADVPVLTQRWGQQVAQLWSSARVRLAVGVLASAAAGIAVWVAAGPTELHPSNEWLAAEGQSVHHLLDDGSSIELSPGANGRLSESDGNVHFALHRGLASFDVVRTKGRQWRVSAGDYGVSVVGTRFSVLYDPSGSFEVAVQRGEVAVDVPTQAAALQLVAGASLIATNDSVTLFHESVTDRESDEVAVFEPSNAGETEGPVVEPAPVASASSPQKARTQPGASRSERAPTRSEQKAKLSELRLLSRARKEIADREYGSALTLIQKHKQQFPAGQLTEEREALRVKALRGMGREQDARKAAGEFRERFPKSVLSPQMPANDE